jgi:hypothetical protein
LERDFLELAKQVTAGTLSCYKVSLIAGIRKKPDEYEIRVRETAWRRRQ